MAQIPAPIPAPSSNLFETRTFVQVVDDLRALGLYVQVIIGPGVQNVAQEAAATAPVAAAAAAPAPETNTQANKAVNVRKVDVSRRSPWDKSPLASNPVVGTTPVTVGATLGEDIPTSGLSIIVLDNTETDTESCDSVSASGGPAATTVPAPGDPNAPHYVVTAGRKVGVFTTPNEASSYVTGVSHGFFKRHDTLELANRAYQSALADGLVVMLQ